MAHDVFISHSSKDKTIADAVCAALEATRIRCWIAPRDIRSGEEWPEAIVKAIASSRIMVLIFSENSNSSKAVANELSLAMDSNVIVIPFKIDDITPQGALQFYLTTTHWLDAMNPPTEKQVQELVHIVGTIMDGSADNLYLKEGKELAVPAGSASAISHIGWFCSGVALLTLCLGWMIIAVLAYMYDPWWTDSRYLDYLVFLFVSIPLLLVGAYCLQRGMESHSLNQPSRGTIPNWWWVIPAFLGFIGGLAAWKKYRHTDQRKALNMLLLGILLTPILALPLFLFHPKLPTSISLASYWSTPRVCTSLTERSDQHVSVPYLYKLFP